MCTCVHCSIEIDLLHHTNISYFMQHVSSNLFHWCAPRLKCQKLSTKPSLSKLFRNFVEIFWEFQNNCKFTQSFWIPCLKLFPKVKENLTIYFLKIIYLKIFLNFDFKISVYKLLQIISKMQEKLFLKFSRPAWLNG